MTTCLINDQINDKRKMSILSKDTLLESGKLFKKNFQSWSLDTRAASSTRCPNFRGLFTSKITWYYTWNLKPKRLIVITLRIESVPPTESVINTIMIKIQSYLQAHLIDHCDFNAPFWKEPTEEDGENSKGINDTLPSDQHCKNKQTKNYWYT